MTFALDPFQHEDAAWLASNFRAAIGHERGVGKTPIALEAARLIGAKNGLIACPASVRTSWYEHAKAIAPMTKWDIVSYNGACDPKMVATLRGDYEVFVPDEVHFTKTLESLRTQAIFGPRGVARRARYIWPLSGTMAPNGRPVELYPMLKALAPAFRDMTFAQYTQKYCGAYFDGRGWNTKGATRIDELAALLKGFLRRRTLDEVYPGRVAPLVERVPLDVNADDLRDILAEQDRIETRPQTLGNTAKNANKGLGDTSTLLRLLGEAKVRSASQYIDDLLETIDKVVVFYHHDVVGAELYHLFAQKGYAPVRYKGGMNDAQKASAVREFKLPICRVFLGQDQAAGTGINGLQEAASTAVIVEPSWDPGTTTQLIGRLDRRGQRDPLVDVKVLYARGTLDMVKTMVHDRKEKTGERLMPKGPVGGAPNWEQWL